MLTTSSWYLVAVSKEMKNEYSILIGKLKSEEGMTWEPRCRWKDVKMDLGSHSLAIWKIFVIMKISLYQKCLLTQCDKSLHSTNPEG